MYGCSLGWCSTSIGMATGVVRTIVQYEKMVGLYEYISTTTIIVITSIFGSIRSRAYSWVAFVTNRRLIVSVESGGKVLREIFTAIMTHLRRVAYVRNRSAGMQNMYVVLIWLRSCWVDAGVSYVCAYLIWGRTGVVRHVHTGVVWCVRMRRSTDTGVQIYRYERSTFLLRAY